MASEGSKKTKTKLKHIYELPYTESQKLCDILDCDNKWEELGGAHFKLDLLLLQKFGRALQSRGSPTKELLIHLKQLNCTVDLLFIYLSRMKHYQAMQVIAPFVSERVERLLPAEPGCTTLLNSFRNTMYTKPLGNENGWPPYQPPHGHYQPYPVNYYKQSSSGRTVPLSPPYLGSISNMQRMNYPSPKIPVEEYVPQCCETIFNGGNPSHFNKFPEPLDNKQPEKENFNAPSLEGSLPSKHFSSLDKSCEENSVGSSCVENLREPVEKPPKEIAANVIRSDDSFTSNSHNNAKILNLQTPPQKISKENNAPVKKTESFEESCVKKHEKIADNPPVSYKVKNHVPSDNPSTKRKGSDPTTFSLQSTVLQCSFQEIATATSNFHTRELGRGGFGVVYFGNWKNQPVAIKYIKRKDNPGFTLEEDAKLKQSLTELRTLDSCRHDNILPLYGYCLDNNGLCIIYRYMCNGSLEDRLRCKNNTPPLTWLQRCQIMKGVSCGIDYLHSLPIPLIHGDIKSANILLDKDYEPRLGDFGLVRKGEFDEKSYIFVKHLHGTRPYLPEEYLRNHKLYTKLDTYSFGIVLFEVATGERAYDERRSKHLELLSNVIRNKRENLESLRDKRAGEDYAGFFDFFMFLGQKCTEKPKDRPDQSKVVEYLNEQLRKSENLYYVRKLSFEKLSASSPEDRMKHLHAVQQNMFPHNYQPYYPPKFIEEVPQNLHALRHAKVPIEQTVPEVHEAYHLTPNQSPSLIAFYSGAVNENTKPPSYNDAMQVSYQYPPRTTDHNPELAAVPYKGESNQDKAYTMLLPNITELGNKTSGNEMRNEADGCPVPNRHSEHNKPVIQSSTTKVSSDDILEAEDDILQPPVTARNKSIDDCLRLVSGEFDEKLNME